MNHYLYHILLVLILSVVVIIINVMAFNSKNATDYLYLFDLTYAIGNSTHFVALSISDKGISVRDEVSGK
ncbi:MAG: hypothetical protein ACP5TX_06135 [Thermoplasmata archaeon]